MENDYKVILYQIYGEDYERINKQRNILYNNFDIVMRQYQSLLANPSPVDEAELERAYDELQVSMNVARRFIEKHHIKDVRRINMESKIEYEIMEEYINKLLKNLDDILELVIYLKDCDEKDKIDDLAYDARYYAEQINFIANIIKTVMQGREGK